MRRIVLGLISWVFWSFLIWVALLVVCGLVVRFGHIEISDKVLSNAIMLPSLAVSLASTFLIIFKNRIGINWRVSVVAAIGILSLIAIAPMFREMNPVSKKEPFVSLEGEAGVKKNARSLQATQGMAAMEMKMNEVQDAVYNLRNPPCKVSQSPATDGLPPFVSINICGNVAWWLGAEFHPFGQIVRGIPVKEISSNWCKANEFTDELFPKELTNGLPGADIEAIQKGGGTFSLMGKFDGVNKKTVLVGVYETCDSKKAGTFLLALNINEHGKPHVAFLKQYEKAFFAFLMPISEKRFLLADCYGCDSDSVFTWTGAELGEHIALKGEKVCLKSGTEIYSSNNINSKLVFKTSKLENAVVLGVGLRQGDYFWHRIQLDNENVGFALNSAFNFEPGLCQ